MEYHFYIVENKKSTNEQHLKSGTFILKIPTNFPQITEGNGPYNSLRGLKRNSEIFKNLIVNNPKRASQIRIDKNIYVMTEFLATERGKTFALDEITLFQHTKGRINNGKVTGVHFFDSKKVKVTKIVNKCTDTNVLEAEIEFFDIKTEKWYAKDKPTTLFPVSWSRHKLFRECNFALENKEKAENFKNIYLSKTISGVNVEIIIVKEKVKSIYPVIK